MGSESLLSAAQNLNTAGMVLTAVGVIAVVANDVRSSTPSFVLLGLAIVCWFAAQLCMRRAKELSP